MFPVRYGLDLYIPLLLVYRINPVFKTLHDSQSRQTVKYGHESRGTQNQECAGEGQQQFSSQSVLTGLITVLSVVRGLCVSE
jgi:hypothetical protein